MTSRPALKAFLRRTPTSSCRRDRDLETGSIAIKAALTGHLVLSTCTPTMRLTTITRMVDMGIRALQRGERL